MCIHILHIYITYVWRSIICQVGVGKRVCTKGEGQLRSPMAPILHMCTYIDGHHQKECHQNEVGSIKSVHPRSAT